MTYQSTPPPWQRLSDPVDGDLLVYFRIVFGIVAGSWVVKQVVSGAVEAFYIQPRFHFHYFGFEWVQPFSAAWTHLEFLAMGIAAGLITIGAGYRAATIVFAVGFTHLFLLDKCLYQNHYYLICLVAWLMILVPANRQLAVDAHFRSNIRSTQVPKRAIWLLRFQIALPYFYGGIAKLNADWLVGEPMRSMLAQRTDFPIIGEFFTQEWCVYLFAYGGLLFDLLVVPALLTKRFRIAACFAAMFFHLMNAWLFTIGVFPWFMLLTLPMFFSPGSLRSLVAKTGLCSDLAAADLAEGQPTPDQRDANVHDSRIEEASSDTSLQIATTPKLWLCFLAVFVAWQIAFPLRHFLIPGNPSWTEEGHYFAWHMLVRGKRSALRYNALDRTSARVGTVDLRPYVSEFQLNRVSRDPRMIHELSQYISTDLRRLGFREIEVRALSLVSMNGRKPQLLIDPQVDLSKEKVGWGKPTWIVPLHEPLRNEPWEAPVSEWQSILNEKDVIP